MKVSFTGIVREIKDWSTDKDGNNLPAEKVTSQILFLDRGTGGDVSLTYPHNHGLKVGQDVNVEVEVKPTIRNFKLTMYVQPTPVAKKSA